MNSKYAQSKGNKRDGGLAAEESLVNSKYAHAKGNKE
jgi:hypothetical protein